MADIPGYLSANGLLAPFPSISLPLIPLFVRLGYVPEPYLLWYPGILL